MPTLTEELHPGEFLISEAPGNLSREEVTVETPSNLKAGSVLGRRVVADASPAVADGGNTGDGVAGAVTLGPLAEVGVYTIECVAAAANSGTFSVVTPSGDRLDDLTVAVAYVSDHVNLTIADGAADFVVGDKFTITVAAGSNKVVLLDLTADDGAQVAWGILWGAIDASAADVNGAAIARNAEVLGAELTWPAGITADQQNAAIAQLAARSIIVR